LPTPRGRSNLSRSNCRRAILKSGCTAASGAYAPQTNGKDNGKEEIIIISSDSLHSEKGKDNIRSYSSSCSSSSSSSISNEGRSGERYTVIRRGSKENIDNDSTVEKTRFVIAKDGMVVTIEGNDEAKAKELAKEIESKLGVNAEGSDKKENVNVETKKIIKK